METREYHTVDKSTWAPGPWQQEPDKRQWQDPETGLPCLIVRGPAGALCGYVGVPPGHPWYEKSYAEPVGACTEHCNAENDIHWAHSIGSRLRVHGGISHSDRCRRGEDESRGICHVPAPGEPDETFWFGFDCAHHLDLMPKSSDYLRHFQDGEYRDIDFVTAEVTRLAKQLSEVHG